MLNLCHSVMLQTSPLTLNSFLKHCFYVALFVTQAVGLLLFPFNYKTKKFSRNNRRSKIYCGILHVCYCGLLPFAITSNFSNQSAYSQSSFYVALNHFITALRLPALLVTLWGVWWHSERFINLIQDFEKLRLENFHTLSEARRNAILERNDRLIWLKLVTAVSLMIMFYVRIFMFVRRPSWPFILLSLYYGWLECLTVYNVNFFFCGICYANCSLRFVKAKIMDCDGFYDPEIVHHLSGMFGEIFNLTKELIAIFQWQLLTIMLAAMVALIALFFNLAIWWYTSTESFKFPLMLFALQAAFINIGEILVTAFVCCDTKNCSRDIQEMLMDISMTCNAGHGKTVYNKVSGAFCDNTI